MDLGDDTGRPSGRLDRILCAYDGSASARCAFEFAAEIAAARGAELHLLAVVQIDDLYAAGYERDGFDPDGSIGEIYDEARRGLKGLAASEHAHGVRLALHVTGGASAATVIGSCALEYGCGLIVLGTHGRRGIARAVLGSTAEGVIRTATIPVLVVHEQSCAAVKPATARAFARPRI